MIPRLRSARLAVVVALLFVPLAPLAGCGGVDPNVTPQAKLAHYGTTVAKEITTVQKFVTEQTTAGTIPVEPARTLTGVNQKLVDQGRLLSDALKTYDAAVTLDAKHLAEAEVMRLVASFNATIGEAYNVKVDTAAAAQVYALYANVSKIVATVSSEIAKGWTVS